MNESHVITITIDPAGNIKGQVSGVKGTSCTDLTKWLEKLGQTTETKLTDDYYKKPDNQTVKTLG